MHAEALPVLIIGGGRVGAAFAFQLLQHHIPVIGIVESSKTRRTLLRQWLPDVPLVPDAAPLLIQQAGILLISVQDDAIPAVVDSLNRMKTEWREKTVAHTSGAFSAGELLRSLWEQGASVASVHPIYAFADKAPVPNQFRNLFFDLEGDPKAVALFSEMVEKLGGIPFRVSSSQKTAIHLASVLYSNYFVILSQLVREVLAATGVSEELHWKPFEPLIQSTFENLKHKLPVEALTGPLKRGDVSSLRKHKDFLMHNVPHLFPLYARLALYMLPYLNLAPEKAQQIEVLLSADPR